jgi:hypothetical protein
METVGYIMQPMGWQIPYCKKKSFLLFKKIQFY